MLSRLIEGEDERHNPDIEESQMRACNLLCKVFLQRLPLISSLYTFNDLWVGILDTMDRYMHIDRSELLVSTHAVIYALISTLILYIYDHCILHTCICISKYINKPCINIV